MKHNLSNFIPDRTGAAAHRSPVCRRARGIRALAALAVLTLAASPAAAQYRMDKPVIEGTATPQENLPITEKPNAQIPLELEFTRSDGKQVKLKDVFNHGRPVILSLVYFSCPNLCGFSQESLLQFVRNSPRGITLGQDYDILVVSIDHEDKADDAALKRKNYLAMVPLPESQAGFTYLTGSKENIRQLADTVGFPYRFNPPNTDSDKIAHDSGIFICTPDGRLSQTILGVQYEPGMLHYRLREASGGRIGGHILGAALSCGAMWFNPNTGRYEHNPWFYAGTATAIFSMLFVGTFLSYLWKTERDRSKTLAQPPKEPQDATP